MKILKSCIFLSYLWLDPKVTKNQGFLKMAKKDSAGYCGDSTRRMSIVYEVSDCTNNMRCRSYCH